MKKRIKVSLVIPCFNEEGNIRPFFDACTEAFKDIDKDFELIYVNDGSKDGTQKELNNLLKVETDFYIKVVEFSRNFGKESAMFAGLDNSTGDYVVIIDADLQQPPKLLVPMMEKLDEEESYDVVCYFQDKRIEGKRNSFLKRGFYKTISRMTDTEYVDGASDFRMMRRYVVDSILSMTEKNRFSKGIFSWVGFNTCYLPYVPEERKYGKSSFTLSKLFKYAFSGIMAFSVKPLKLATYLGITTSVLAFIYLIALLIEKIFFTIEISGYATIVALILIIGGLNLFCLGIIGEYIAGIYLETKKRPIYLARSIKENKKDNYL